MFLQMLNGHIKAAIYITLLLRLISREHEHTKTSEYIPSKVVLISVWRVMKSRMQFVIILTCWLMNALMPIGLMQEPPVPVANGLIIRLNSPLVCISSLIINDLPGCLHAHVGQPSGLDASPYGHLDCSLQVAIDGQSSSKTKRSDKKERFIDLSWSLCHICILKTTSKVLKEVGKSYTKTKKLLSPFL